MPVYLNSLQVVSDGEYGFLDFMSKTKISDVWARIGPLLFQDLTGQRARAMLAEPRRSGSYTELIDADHLDALRLLARWIVSPQIRRYETERLLASTMADALRSPELRRNYFYKREGENENIAEVIYDSAVPEASAGWSQPAFFAALGNERHAVDSLERNAEQEYLLQGMVKGAMWEAAEIARKLKVGISVRPTGVLAHMGIESGNPTKAQEFKNKTSKDVDLFLCDEMSWQEIGTVVHYDPRVGWTSSLAKSAAESGRNLGYGQPTESQWKQKITHINTVRMPQLDPYVKSKKLKPPDWSALKEMFFSRAREYQEEDHEYRFGHYAPHTTLVGPYIRLKVRPQSNMYGDHDLFGFTMTDEYGRLTLDTHSTLRRVQVMLQHSNTFQAQHGGIWNWRPSEEFHKGIKRKIMGAHSPPDGDPLIYILPDGKAHAAFYMPGKEVLEPAWDHFPAAQKWLESTYSGKKFLENRFNSATKDIVDWLNSLGNS